MYLQVYSAVGLLVLLVYLLLLFLRAVFVKVFTILAVEHSVSDYKATVTHASIT